MKMMMISDYDAPIGGIEQYIRDAAQLLATENHDVSVVWLSLPSRILHRVRALLMPLTACNIFFAIKLSYIIITKKPQLLWRHSVSRYIGWFPIWVASLFHIRTWMMYHDLWYFHPYPRLLTDIQQIPKEQDLQSWLQAGHETGQTWVINNTLMTLKYRGTSAIRWSLIRSCEYHLVPSPYMVPILESRWIETKKIHILGHFGRIE